MCAEQFLYVNYVLQYVNGHAENGNSCVKGIGPQTIVCALYESLHVAEQLATNFMKPRYRKIIAV